MLRCVPSHVAIVWLSCGDRVAVVWRSCGDRVAVMWRSFGDRVAAVSCVWGVVPGMVWGPQDAVGFSLPPSLSLPPAPPSLPSTPSAPPSRPSLLPSRSSSSCGGPAPCISQGVRLQHPRWRGMSGWGARTDSAQAQTHSSLPRQSSRADHRLTIYILFIGIKYAV